MSSISTDSKNCLNCYTQSSMKIVSKWPSNFETGIMIIDLQCEICLYKSFERLAVPEYKEVYD